MAKTEEMKYATLMFHYAHAVPGVPSLSLNVFNDNNEWCGVMVFGPGMTLSTIKSMGLVNGQLWELQRVALNGKQGHNATSQAIAMAIHYIRTHYPSVKALVSYADKYENHTGVIYQATNWIYTGGEYGCSAKLYVHKDTGKQIRSRSYSSLNKEDKKNYTNTGIVQKNSKHRYFLLLDKKDKRLKNLLESMRKPYPKKHIEILEENINATEKTTPVAVGNGA